MKAAINKDGLLIIESETELESYALKQWLKNNPQILANVLFIANNPFNQKTELRPQNPSTKPV